VSLEVVVGSVDGPPLCVGHPLEGEMSHSRLTTTCGCIGDYRKPANWVVDHQARSLIQARRPSCLSTADRSQKPVWTSQSWQSSAADDRHLEAQFIVYIKPNTC